MKKYNATVVRMHSRDRGSRCADDTNVNPRDVEP